MTAINNYLLLTKKKIEDPTFYNYYQIDAIIISFNASQRTSDQSILAGRENLSFLFLLDFNTLHRGDVRIYIGVVSLHIFSTLHFYQMVTV